MLSCSDNDDGKAYWYKLQNVFVKICLIMKTNLNSPEIASGLSMLTYQLVKFNAIKQKCEQNVLHDRHKISEETPLCIGLYIHLKASKILR